MIVTTIIFVTTSKMKTELIDDAIDRMARYMRPLRLKIKPENKTPHTWRLRNTD